MTLKSDWAAAPAVPASIMARSLAALSVALLLSLAPALTGCATRGGGTPGGAVGHEESGLASFYAAKYQFRKTANGERFNHMAKTAAHRTLPFGTRLRVVNRETGESVVVRVNDRGPFIDERIIDLSRAASF